MTTEERLREAAKRLKTQHPRPMSDGSYLDELLEAAIKEMDARAAVIADVVLDGELTTQLRQEIGKALVTSAQLIRSRPDEPEDYVIVNGQNFNVAPEVRDLVDGYIEAQKSTQELTRELDVAMHGEFGAAKQASLCDLVHPARDMRIALLSAHEALQPFADYWHAGMRGGGRPSYWQFEIASRAHDEVRKVLGAVPKPEEREQAKNPAPAPDPTDAKHDAAAIIYDAMLWAAAIPGPAAGPAPRYDRKGNSEAETRARHAAQQILELIKHYMQAKA